jgi:hypothetical protein
MLEGFYGARKVTMGSNRGRLDPQAMLWSRSLRGTHDNNVKKLRKEREVKRRDRLRKNGIVREPMLNSEEELAPQSANSQTPSCSQGTPSESPRRPRPKSAEVQGAKKLLSMLRLDHMLSDDADDDTVVEPSKQKALKGKGKTRHSSQRRPSASSKKVSSPVKRDVSPLTSWRMDPSLPESLREKLSAKRDRVTMSSQKTVKEPVESDQSSEEDEPPHVMQWRYKPLPEEARKETRKSSDGGGNPKCNRKSTEMPHFDLDDLRIVVVAMQKEHRQCIRSVADSLEHHTRQIVLLTKANSSLADQVESMEKEMKVLRAMQFVCTTIP